jgi:hypothetical protein
MVAPSMAIHVIFMGFYPDDGHQLSVQLDSHPFVFLKDCHGQATVEVAQCFGISCGTRPWLADEVKWEALDAEEGAEGLATRNERDAPPYYWDVKRLTL